MRGNILVELLRFFGPWWPSVGDDASHTDGTPDLLSVGLFCLLLLKSSVSQKHLNLYGLTPTSAPLTSPHAWAMCTSSTDLSCMAHSTPHPPLHVPLPPSNPANRWIFKLNASPVGWVIVFLAELCPRKDSERCIFLWMHWWPCLWLPADVLAAVGSMGPRSFPVHPSALSLADRGSNPSALCLPTVENLTPQSSAPPHYTNYLNK